MIIRPGIVAAAKPAGGGYVAKAVHFGYTGASITSLVASSGYAGPDVSKMLWSCWYRPIDLSNFPDIFNVYNSPDDHTNSITGPSLGINTPTLGQVSIQCFSAAAGNFSYIIFGSSTPPALGNWHHIAQSSDTNFSSGNKVGQLYIDGVNGLDHVADDQDAFSSQWNGQYIEFGGISDGAIYEFCDIQIWLGINPDLSDPAVLGKLISAGAPVNPATAATAFGQQTFLFSGDHTTFPINQGAGGAFTLTGPLTDGQLPVQL